MSLSGGQSRSELALLADPAELAKRIAQLESAEEQANGVIALVGPANEILAIRERLSEERAGVEASIEQTKEDAARIVANAQQQAIDIETEARSEAASIIAGAQVREDDAQVRQNTAQENLAETEREQSRLRTWDSELSEKENSLHERALSLNETEASLLQEKTQLTDIRERLSDFLG